jgi:hypothetical protein
MKKVCEGRRHSAYRRLTLAVTVRVELGVVLVVGVLTTSIPQESPFEGLGLGYLFVMSIHSVEVV